MGWCDWWLQRRYVELSNWSGTVKKICWSLNKLGAMRAVGALLLVVGSVTQASAALIQRAIVYHLHHLERPNSAAIQQRVADEERSTRVRCANGLVRTP